MGKKGGKKDPNAELLIPEDPFVRGKKLLDVKSAPKAPKGGDFTRAELCIPPELHDLPELKNAIHYWQQCVILRYSERDMKAPSEFKAIESESTVKKPHKRGEINDVWKYLKGQVKQANKRTDKFLKQLMKKEGKETKRENLVKEIAGLNKQLNDELKFARGFADQKELFHEKWFKSSKLETWAPAKIYSSSWKCPTSSLHGSMSAKMKY